MKNLTELEQLSMLECDSVSGIDPINEIANLKALSLPRNTSYIQMAEVLSKHPDLEVLQLVTQDSMPDLSLLSGLSSLKALTLATGNRDLTPLHKLKDLAVMVIDDESWAELEEEIIKLKAALPGVSVVPGSGFCLGSGWILLLIPLFLVFRLICIKRYMPFVKIKF